MSRGGGSLDFPISGGDLVQAQHVEALLLLVDVVESVGVIRSSPVPSLLAHECSGSTSARLLGNVDGAPVRGRGGASPGPVSYTHLTLPTICSV